jgi:CBS domain containing-hemolysin-like protein
MAVVLDDDERLKGLVTIEDLLEEIVGDIEGEVG